MSYVEYWIKRITIRIGLMGTGSHYLDLQSSLQWWGLYREPTVGLLNGWLLDWLFVLMRYAVLTSWAFPCHSDCCRFQTDFGTSSNTYTASNSWDSYYI